MNDPQRAAGLVKGTLDLLVLEALRHGKQHGYGVALWLEKESAGHLRVEDSAIYQALHRLQGRRLVQAAWGTSENNRRARYYRLTAAGRRQLVADRRTWQEYADSVAAILALAESR